MPEAVCVILKQSEILCIFLFVNILDALNRWISVKVRRDKLDKFD